MQQSLTVQAVLSALSNELLCVNTELRLVYDAYSSRHLQKPWGWGHPWHSSALTSAQMWELMRECGVPQPDCSLAHINVALAQVGHIHGYSAFYRHAEGSHATASQSLPSCKCK